MKEEKQEDQN